MNKLKKHIAGFLLIIFTSGIIIPAPLFHHLFANHNDAADNHCQYYHKDLGRHLEEKENHCDVFKANTPLYDALKINQDFNVSVTYVSPSKVREIKGYSFSIAGNLPARAPPVA